MVFIFRAHSRESTLHIAFSIRIGLEWWLGFSRRPWNIGILSKTNDFSFKHEETVYVLFVTLFVFGKRFGSAAEMKLIKTSNDVCCLVVQQSDNFMSGLTYRPRCFSRLQKYSAIDTILTTLFLSISSQLFFLLRVQPVDNRIVVWFVLVLPTPIHLGLKASIDTSMKIVGTDVRSYLRVSICENLHARTLSTEQDIDCEEQNSMGTSLNGGFRRVILLQSMLNALHKICLQTLTSEAMNYKYKFMFAPYASRALRSRYFSSIG